VRSQGASDFYLFHISVSGGPRDLEVSRVMQVIGPRRRRLIQPCCWWCLPTACQVTKLGKIASPPSSLQSLAGRMAL
jgi:hypothetical protein